MQRFSLVILFAVIYVAAGKQHPNLLQKASPLLQNAISKGRQLMPGKAEGLNTRTQVVADVSELMRLDAENILQNLQQTAGLAQQYVQYVYTRIQQALMSLQGLGANIFEHGEQILQQLILSLSNARISRVVRSTRIPWLVQLVINALTSSSHFQNLVAQDPVIQCIETNGIEANSDLVIGLMENNQALEFVQLDMVQDCLNANGGMQHFVQTSPLIGWAWNMAGTLGATNVMTETIVEHLGHDLGGQINQWLHTRPKSNFVGFLNIPIHLIESRSALLPYLGNLFSQVESVVQHFIQETIGHLIETAHLFVEEFIAFLEPLQQNFPETVQQVITELRTLFSGQLDVKFRNKKF